MTAVQIPATASSFITAKEIQRHTDIVTITIIKEPSQPAILKT